MLNLALRLLPGFALLAFLASPELPDFRDWADRGALTTAVEANGMVIDPNGEGPSGGSPGTTGDPADPDQ
jgi:hypothetical protein